MAPIQQPEQPKRRTHTVALRLTEEEYKQIEIIAREFDIQLSILARDFLLQAVRLYVEQPRDE